MTRPTTLEGWRRLALSRGARLDQLRAEVMTRRRVETIQEDTIVEMQGAAAARELIIARQRESVRLLREQTALLRRQIALLEQGRKVGEG